MAKDRILTVSELTRYVKELLDEDGVLNRVWLRGEVSNFKRHYSGHLYFSLKDSQAALRCVMFRGNASRLRFEPENGMSVLALGSVGVYERDGVYQLYVEELQPDGAGALNLAYQQLKERLEREGLFDPAHKRPIPRLPRKVGVVTALTGAAIRDIVHVTRRRYPNVHLVVAPALVQGEDAPPQIARAIAALGEVDGVDVIIAGRGGGSLEDLWAFNDERVARAIYRSKVPVISAVGHETDFTIADFVADLRAPTPSAGAEMAVPDRREEERHLAALKARLISGLRRTHAARAAHLQALLRRPVLVRPKDGLRQRRQRLDDIGHLLETHLRHTLAARRAQRDGFAGRLQALSPLAVLGRGYSLARRVADGRVVRSVGDAPPGSVIDVRVSDGELRCRVARAAPQGAAPQGAGPWEPGAAGSPQQTVFPMEEVD